MNSMPDPSTPEAPRKYAWPKYVLAAVSLFLFICVVWTIKEVNRLKRAKQDAMDSPPAAQGTN